MKLKKLFFVAVFFLGTVVSFAANSNTETLLTYVKESCRGDKGWHAEYNVSVEEKKSDKPQKLFGKMELLLLCPSNIRLSFSENNNFFEFISDSVQAWIIRQKHGEKVRSVEQYNSLSKRGASSLLALFSRALDLSRASLGEVNSLFSVEKVKIDGQKIKRFEIKNRKNSDLLTIDFGSDLEPRFDEVLLQQKNYSLMIKFQKQIDDQKSTDLKNYNFYAQPEDKITLFLDKAG
jgi:outer membrane lipoprotein-sorting protein